VDECKPLNHGVYVGQLAKYPELDEALNYPSLGDAVRPAPSAISPHCAQQSEARPSQPVRA